MSYSAEDLEAVKKAIMALATGDRVVQVTVDGRTTQWQQASLPELKALRNEIAEEIGEASPRPIRVAPRRSR